MTAEWGALAGFVGAGALGALAAAGAVARTYRAARRLRRALHCSPSCPPKAANAIRPPWRTAPSHEPSSSNRATAVATRPPATEITTTVSAHRSLPMDATQPHREP